MDNCSSSINVTTLIQSPCILFLPEGFQHSWTHDQDKKLQAKMDTTLWMNGQHNYQFQQNSQQHQQFWNQAGYSNTYPQYPEVNDPQRAQFNPGYGQQTSTTYQQLTTNPGYRPPQNNYGNVNVNQQTAYDYAQTRNVNQSINQWQASACQMTTQQDPTVPGNWSNQRPPKNAMVCAEITTAQAETFPYQNMQNSVSNPNLMPMTFNYFSENVNTTVAHKGGGYKESNTDSCMTAFQWRGTATHAKQVESTRKDDARNNQTQTPYKTSARMAPPRFISPRNSMPPPSFSSSGQLPVSQTHLQLQSAAGAAPAFSNSAVFRAPPPYNVPLSSVKNGQQPPTSHLVNPNNPSRNPPPSSACQKAVAVVQPLSQKHTQVTTRKSCPDGIGQQKDTLMAGWVDDIEIDGNTLPYRFQPLPECDGSEKRLLISSGSYQKHQSNANIEPTDDGTVTTSLQSNGNGKESKLRKLMEAGKAHQSVTLDSCQGKESEMDDVGQLSLVPVMTWSHEQLTTLIKITTEVQIQPDNSKSVVGQLIKYLWDNDIKNILRLINTNYYRDLMFAVIKYCKATEDLPILSQVENKILDRLKKNCTVLEHGSVHFESPYVSPWLNVNVQLDDIDNEFGFPSSLTNCQIKCNTETQPMQTRRKEMAIENVPQMASALFRHLEKARSIIQTECTPSIVPDDALTADLSDPLDLLEMEMMCPDQARMVFEHLKNGSSLIEFQSNEVSTTEKTTSLDEFCCIHRWMDVILGTEPSIQCSCRSQSEANKPCEILTDPMDPSEEENIVEVSLNPMRLNSSKVSKIIDFTTQFEVPQKGNDDTPFTTPSTMEEMSSIHGSISTTVLEKNCNKELKPASTGETLNIEPKQPKDNKRPITESSDDHMSTPKAVWTMEQKQSNSDAHDLKSIGSSLTTGPTRLSPTVKPKADGPPNLKMRLGLSRKRKRTIGKVISMDVLDPSKEEKMIEVTLTPMCSNPPQVSKIVDLGKQFEVPQKENDNTPITPASTMDLNDEEEEMINDILNGIYGSISTTAIENNYNKELKPARTGETLNPITESSDDHTSTPKAVWTMKQSNGDTRDLKSICSRLTTAPTRLSPTAKADCSPNLKVRLWPSRKRKRTIGKVLQPFEDPVTSVYQPALKDTSNGLIKEKVVADDSKTIKLALFGTTAQKSGVSGPRGKSHSSSQYFSGLHPPPSLLTVKSCSVRNRISEEWRNSYLPITRKNGERKTVKDTNRNSGTTSATVAPVEAELVDMERLPVSLEQTFPLGSGKKRRGRKPNVLTLETTQMPSKCVTKTTSKKPKFPDMRRKENRGLRLLHHHLDAKAGPRRRKDKRASVLGESPRGYSTALVDQC